MDLIFVFYLLYISKPFYAQELWTCLLKYLTPISLEEHDTSLLTHKLGRKDNAIDENIGLGHAVNDKELYEHMKRNFYLENVNRYKEIAECMNADDLSDALKIIHSLKSNANWIGAVQLGNIAADIEDNCFANRHCSNEQLTLLNDELDRVLKELAPLAGQKSELFNTKRTSLALKPEELIEKLQPLLASGNADSNRYVQEITEIFAEHTPYCDDLLKQIEDYDFDEACLTLEKIKERVKTG